MSELTPLCPYCKAFSKKATGKDIYPHRPDLYAKQFYVCTPCDAYVGCHEFSGKPLGRLANGALRKAKMSAHGVFDPLWRGAGVAGARTKAYAALAKVMGIDIDDCHIGQFSERQCLEVIRICNEEVITTESIRQCS